MTSTLVASIPVWAQPGQCDSVGGVPIANIAAIDGVYNLEPAFGDLHGSVAAKIVSSTATTYTLQHYWVTTSGDTILMKPAVLTATYPATALLPPCSNPAQICVPLNSCPRVFQQL